MTTPSNFTTIESRFAYYHNFRQPMLDKYKEYSLYTVPSLYDDTYSSTDENDELPTTYNTTMHTLLSRYVSKVANGVFPLQHGTFPKLDPVLAIDTLFVDPDQSKELKDNIERVERLIYDVLSNTNFRTILEDTLLKIAVHGNCVVHRHENQLHFTNYHIKDYIVIRNNFDMIEDLILVDWLQTEYLPEELQRVNGGQPNHAGYNTERLNSTRPGESREPLYTRITPVKDSSGNTTKWNIQKEFRQTIIADNDVETLNYYVLRGKRRAKESYGRPIIEEHMGEIRSLEATSKALVESLAAMAEGRILVDPSSMTTIDMLLDSSNWSVIPGREGDVSVLQPNARIAVEAMIAARDNFRRSLGIAFHDEATSRRDAERVTADEINRDANLSEQTLGPFFESLAYDLQLPLVKDVLKYIKENSNNNQIINAVYDAVFKDEALTVNVRTGIDAITKQLQTSRYLAFIDVLSRIPPDYIQRLDGDNLMRQVMTALGLDVDRAFLSDAELQARDQRRTQNEAALAAAQSAGQTVGQNIPTQ